MATDVRPAEPRSLSPSPRHGRGLVSETSAPPLVVRHLSPEFSSSKAQHVRTVLAGADVVARRGGAVLLAPAVGDSVYTPPLAPCAAWRLRRRRAIRACLRVRPAAGTNRLHRAPYLSDRLAAARSPLRLDGSSGRRSGANRPMGARAAHPLPLRCRLCDAHGIRPGDENVAGRARLRAGGRLYLPGHARALYAPISLLLHVALVVAAPARHYCLWHVPDPRDGAWRGLRLRPRSLAVHPRLE